MFVTVYDKATGTISSCNYIFDPNDAELQAAEGEDWVEGESDPNRQLVSNGTITYKPTEDIETYEIEVAWTALRRERKLKLKDSDWTQVPDAPVDKQAWATYRQELRDLPANTIDPREVVWPTPPD